MTPDQTTIAAWTALLAMPPPERSAFVRSAAAYAAAHDTLARDEPVVVPTGPLALAPTPPSLVAPAAASVRPPAAKLAPVSPGRSARSGRARVGPPLVGPQAASGPDGDRLVRIGDHPPIEHLATLFESGPWQEAWQPGDEYHLYLLGCPGLGRLALRGAETLAKLGTCAIGSLDRRRRELGRQHYGSIVRRADGYASDTGWDEWKPFRKLQIGPTPAACPVRGSTQSLILTAPLGWTAGAVEALVNDALSPYRLQAYADSDIGRAACKAQGVDPGELVRYSPTPDGVEAATELTLVRAQVDTPRVAALIATALARAVRLGAAAPEAPAWQGLDRLSS